MTETSRFFDGTVGYDRTNIAEVFARFIRDGYIPGYLNELLPFQHTPPDMSVNIATGGAAIQGFHYFNDGVVNLPIEAAHPTLWRTDRIILRLTTTGSPGSIVLAVLKGGTPNVAPTLTRNATVWEISIAQVSVPALTTAITTPLIYSERAIDTVCGVARPASLGKEAHTILDLNSQRITELGAPTNATDAARLQDIAATKIDDLTAGDDNTDLNAGTTKHGLCPKGTNTGKFLRDDITWQAVTVYKTASASATLQKSADTEVGINATIYTTAATILIPANYNWGSVFRVAFDLKCTDPYYAYFIGELFFDGQAVGTEYVHTSSTYATRSQDLSLGPGILSLKGRTTMVGWPGYFRNFRVYCTDTNTAPGW